MGENENIDALKERFDYLKKRLLTLEWDKTHNQLNAGMEYKYEEFKKELAELESRFRESVREEESVIENETPEIAKDL